MIADLKPYPEYKESGLPWLGRVPGHWPSERAKWLFTKMDRPVRDEDEVVTCFRDGVVTLRRNRRLRGFTEATVFSGYQGIRKGDLVIHGMDAFAGAIGVSDSDGKGTPVYSVCQPRQGVSATYYAHLLRQMSQSQWILALAKGIRERSTDFRFEMFGSQRVPLPPPPEQAAIVRFLDWANGRLERAIRAKRKVIALLNEQKQAIIHRAVTRGLDPSVPLKPSGVPWLGDIPAHWEVRRFKTSIGFQEGPGIMLSDFRESGIPLLRISCLAGPDASLKGCNHLSPAKVREKWSHFSVRPGDYLLSASGSTGAVRRATKEVVGAIPYTGIIRLWAKSSASDMEYLRLFMSARPFSEQIAVAKSGVGIEHFGPTHLKRMWILQPPVEEQRTIVSYIADTTGGLQTAISRLTREIDLLREYRTRLVADVVTGKLDVREAAARLPDEAPLDPVEEAAGLDDETEAVDEEPQA